MHNFIAITFLAAVVLAQKGGDNQILPEKADNGDMGGIFGIGPSSSLGSVPANILGGLIATGSESPSFGKGAGKAVQGGTGPYKAAYATDTTLPNHTIYAPKSPPKGVKMPVMLFANGLCLNTGNMYPNFLTEIASHGYLVIANGVPGGVGFAKVTQMIDAMDWVMKGEGTKKYGEIDAQNIAVSGQSCGGLEAYSASYHEPRVKLSMIFNVGVFEESRRYLIKELKGPIGWFVGGRKDAGTQFALKDYDLLLPGVPASLMSLDTGHVGTFVGPNGGKYATAAVAFLDWHFRRNETAKRRFFDSKSPGSMVSDKWNVTMKNM